MGRFDLCSPHGNRGVVGPAGSGLEGDHGKPGHAGREPAAGPRGCTPGTSKPGSVWPAHGQDV